jgi:hypothetical protein
VAFDVIGIAAAALVIAYLLLVLVLNATPHVVGLGAGFWNAFVEPLTQKLGELDRANRIRGLEEEMRRTLGLSDEWGSHERSEIVDAALAAQQITVLNQTLRKSVTQCLNAHWAVADGLSAQHMAEAARHPWCNGLRQRVIDLSDLLSQRLEEYPLILDAPELMRLHLGIRWLGPTCATCPYWTTPRSEAPRICPTAKAIGYGHAGAHSDHAVVDAEIVDDHRGDQP